MSINNICGDVKTAAEALSAILGADVTIVDKNFKRIAATGKYENLIGYRIPKNCLFERIFREGKLGYIDRSDSNSPCKDCSARDICTELATIGQPIIENNSNSVVGIIGISVFNETQRQKIITNISFTNEILNKFSKMLVYDTLLNRMEQKLWVQNKEIEKIINSINYGVISLDHEDKIKYLNRSAELLLNINKSDYIGKPLESLCLCDGIEQLKLNKNEGEITLHKSNINLIASKDYVHINREKISTIITIKKNDIIENNKYYTEKKINFKDILGQSASIIQAKTIAKKMAKCNSTIILRGESGTGKELFARAIHFESNRKDKPFVAINCASIPQNLLESELFGYEGGAFSGARKQGSSGKFELANKGTLFLDEIGDLPLSIQPKLLRVLQEKEFRRLGGKDLVKVDVRIMAATNKNLEYMVEKGGFREDLYYRINVIPVQIPSLKERKDDILFIGNYLVKKYCHELGISVKSFSKDLADVLLRYDWPGNIRELENVIQYLVNITENDVIDSSHLPYLIRERMKSNKVDSEDELTLKSQMEMYECSLLDSMLKQYGTSTENKEKIASILGVNLSTLYRKLMKYGLC